MNAKPFRIRETKGVMPKLSDSVFVAAPITLVGIVLALSPVAPVHAQSDDDSTLEEIVVLGIRGSYGRSLDVKREAAGFEDTVSSEDMGKLLDQNIAEALQRVPGVAVQRNQDEGDFVSILGLGPEFVRGTVRPALAMRIAMSSCSSPMQSAALAVRCWQSSVRGRVRPARWASQLRDQRRLYGICQYREPDGRRAVYA